MMTMLAVAVLMAAGVRAQSAEMVVSATNTNAPAAVEYRTLFARSQILELANARDNNRAYELDSFIRTSNARRIPVPVQEREFKLIGDRTKKRLKELVDVNYKMEKIKIEHPELRLTLKPIRRQSGKRHTE